MINSNDLTLHFLFFVRDIQVRQYYVKLGMVVLVGVFTCFLDVVVVSVVPLLSVKLYSKKSPNLQMTYK